MKDQDKTKAQLINELVELHQRVADLEVADTARKRAEEALRIRDWAIESSINAIALADLEGNLTYVNPSFLKLWGYDDAKEVLEKPAVEFWQMEEKAAEVVEALRDRGGWMGELVGMRKDGSLFDLQLLASMVTDEAGKPIRMMASFVDITKRERVEEALQVSEERFALAVRGSDAGLWDWDIQNNSLYWAPRLKELLGYADDELDVDFETFESHLHPDDREHTGAAIEAHLRDRGLYDVEQRLRTKSGEYRWFRARGQALWDEAGNPVRMIGFTTDITERKRAEEALRNSKEELQAIFDSVKDGIALIGMTGKVIKMNKRIIEIGGYTEEEIVGKRLRLLKMFPPQSLAKMLFNFTKLISGQEVTPFDLQVYTKAGEKKDVELRGSLLRKSGEAVGMVGVMRDITERKRAEAALRESEQRLSTTLRSIGDAVIATDAQGLVALMNPVAEDLTGWEEAEAVGKRLEDVFNIINEQTGERAENPVARVLREGVVVGLANHSVLIAKDGTKRPIADSGAPMRDEEGNIIGTVMVFRDITERKRAEEALRESEEKFRILAEQSPNMIFINKKGKVVYANKKCEEITGYKEEEFNSPDFNFINLIAPESRNLAKASFNQHMKGQEVAPYEYTLITKKGKRIEVIHATKLITYEGESAILAIETDITERKRAEEALRQRTEQQEVLLSSIPASVYYKDAELKLVTANKAFAEMVNTPIDQLPGKDAYDLFPKEQAEKFHIDDKEVMESGKPMMNIEEKFTDTEGKTRWAATSKVPYFDEKGKIAGMVGITIDITKRRRAEEELRATLRAKTALLQEVDHRVKNNLQVISSLLSLQAESSQDPQVIQALQDSGRRVRTMAMIHERLSLSADLASIDAGRHVRTLVDYLVGAYSGWERGIIPTVELDEVSLNMDTAIPCSLIISELVSNALEHAFPAERERLGGEDEIRVELRMAGDDQLRLVVSDNGVGLPPGVDMEAPPSLGLQLVKLLAWQLGGTLELDRRAGTAFKITFAGPGV